jgi:hypothetical protein
MPSPNGEELVSREHPEAPSNTFSDSSEKTDIAGQSTRKGSDNAIKNREMNQQYHLTKLDLQLSHEVLLKLMHRVSIE